MSTYKVYYFDARARAEIARMLLAAAEKKFEDVRVGEADWPTVKKDMPQGTVPVLEVDGKKISQSMAIARYLAREFNLYGKTNQDKVMIDQIADTCIDMYEGIIKALFAPDEEQKAKQMEKFKTDQPKILGFLEDLVKAAGKSGFAVGDSLTLADLMLHIYIENSHGQDLLDKFPLLSENRKKIEALPRIKAYLEKRPKTEY